VTVTSTSGTLSVLTPTVSDSIEHAVPHFFGPEHRLFGWYHPAGGPATANCGVVICAPFGFEESCAHRALRHWADALAAAGFPTCRFDYDGTGNSAGSDDDPDRVAAWVSSIVDAAAHLRALSGVHEITLAGVRLGGTLAMAAAERVGADGLILFAAHASGRTYAREVRAFGRLMRAGDADVPNETANPVEQVAGFMLTAATMTELAALDPLGCNVQVNRALVFPRDDIAADLTLADRLERQGVAVERAGVAGYAKMMVDAHESIPPHDVIDASIRWLSARYPRTSATSPRPLTVQESTGISETIRETAVVFGDERRLFGVVTEPTNTPNRTATGIVFINAGSVHHIGPGRAYTAFAREWASLGFAALRMDIGGIGDSDARDTGSDNHPYPEHAVDDIGVAVGWMKERGAARVVVAGLCSGAHASFHAGLEIDGLDGILVINPIVFYWNPACALDVAAWMNYTESRRYSQSAREMGSWIRLIRGEVNVRYALGVGYRRAIELASGAAESIGRRVGLTAKNGEDVGRDLARISDRGVTTLLVFSEGDPGLDFVRRRYARDVRMLERNRTNFSMRVVEGADHTFTRIEARDRLRQLLTAHLIECYRR
jgi:alpha/beta superfamily hydrolase